MKIRVGITLDDKIYVDKLSVYMSVHYGDKLEIYTFSGITKLLSFLKQNALDVLLLGDEEELEELLHYDDMIIIKLTEEDMQNRSDDYGIRLPKYQRASNIYQEIMHYCTAEKIVIAKRRENVMRVHAFCSIVGGAGASTVSAAYAVYLAKKGRKVLYLNLENLGNTGAFFEATGKYTFEEILLALKTKAKGLPLKLESALSKSPENVYFYPSCDNPVDMSQMTADELRTLFAILKKQDYRDIVIDFRLELNERSKVIMTGADQVVLVSDGTGFSKERFQRIMTAYIEIDKKDRSRLVDKFCVFNNKVDETGGEDISNDRVENVGGIPGIRLGNVREIMLYMAGDNNCFQNMN